MTLAGRMHSLCAVLSFAGVATLPLWAALQVLEHEEVLRSICLSDQVEAAGQGRLLRSAALGSQPCLHAPRMLRSCGAVG